MNMTAPPQLVYVQRAYTAPGPRTRVTTGPTDQQQMPPNNASHQSLASTHYSSYSNSSLRSSDSTAATSLSTLISTPPPPLPNSNFMNGGPIEATNSVLNKRAEKDQSLFQICLSLRHRLEGVPGFKEVLDEEEREADADTDPVELLWRVFRRGYPLLMVYTAYRPNTSVDTDLSKVAEKNRPKAAAIKFLGACKRELEMKDEDLFIANDVTDTENTNGFVKVTRVINEILDRMVQEGMLSSEMYSDSASVQTATGKRTQRQHIVDELVRTERTYVQHLELLQAFKNRVEESGTISGDNIHDIFLNLNALLNFQRRFLIRVEHTNAMAEDDQNWGSLFVTSREALCEVYEPYIANQKRCEEVGMREFEKLRMIDGPIEITQMVESPTVLSSFLLKPFQRLSKYPLLLKELMKNGDLGEERKADVVDGMEAALWVLQQANAAVDREDRNDAVEDLKLRVDDWKGLRIEAFGDLLMHGAYTVLKNDSAKKDQEREYRIYLFELILLCCKEVDPSKQKNKLMNKPLLDPRGKPRLQLKGRIFMQNVTDVLKVTPQSSKVVSGSYTCQIFWKGDPGIENFIIKFPTDEILSKFCALVDQQRRIAKETPRTSGTSTTQFTFLQGNMPMENPYKQQYDDGDEDEESQGMEGGSYFNNNSQISLPRSESSISVRSRSGTLDGTQAPPMPPIPRVPPPRFPMPNQPTLSLRTQHLQQAGGAPPSPITGGPESYFSPSGDSPISIRSSSSSQPYSSIPRQQTPNGWHPSEENTRYTAPAMGRMSSREAPGLGGYSAGRNPQRPSLPPQSASYSNSTQNRLRSASSPDIQNLTAAQGRRGATSGPPVPDVPVPPFPTHFAYTPNINRSQNGSPAHQPEPQPNGLTRSSTMTTHLPRDGLPHKMSDFPPSRYDYQPRQSSLQRNVMNDPRATQMSVPPASISPPPSSARSDEMAGPSQLKVRVHCEAAGSKMTLVVATNISYQSLKDRIDAKLQRSTSFSLASGGFKLKYLDEDDLVVIQNDEDVQTAFETWKEQQREQLLAGQLGEINLYCQ